METFFDEVFAPGFAYEFVKITKIYAYPKSYFRHKKIRCYLTHGAPSIPVKTIYLNSVKLRLVLGVFTFVFGWGGNWKNTKQFWSVPFVSDKKRITMCNFFIISSNSACIPAFLRLSMFQNPIFKFSPVVE